MSRRLALPITLDSLVKRTPSVDAVRKRLGGREQSEPGAGEIVACEDESGVIIFVRGNEISILSEEGAVRQTTRADVSTLAQPSAGLLALSADARVFAGLHEGERVRYVETNGEHAEGLLVEKCRYGALLVRDDRTVLGVGFRRLWPLPTSIAS